MITLSMSHVTGIVLTLALISAAGVYSGRKVKNAADFATGGGSAGTAIVAGTVLGTLIGGSSTIGTAQMAYSFGMSALWFTLGAALGSLLLAFAVKTITGSGCTTIQQIIGREYGPAAELLSAVLSSLGTMIAVVAQLLSAAALLSTFFDLSPFVCALIAIGVMACYVTFGGIWGTGLVGIVKMALIYGAVVIGSAAALKNAGGLQALYAGLPAERYLNLFARGAGADFGAALSLTLGVFSTQTYFQAMFAAKDWRTARRGILWGALLMPPVGAGAMLIGVYARNFAGISDASQAFPLFLIHNLPPLLGGVFLAALLTAIVGTGSGLALGVSTVLTKNIYRRFLCRGEVSPKKELWVSRLMVLAALGFALLFTLGDAGEFILQWSIMSMALRAAVSFVPMCCALFLPGRVPGSFVVAAIVAGPLVVLALELRAGLAFDPVFAGLAAAALICLAGGCWRQRRGKPREGRRPGA